MLTAADFRISRSVWEAAKSEARDEMIQRARGRDTIAYSDLVAKIQSLPLAPHDLRLFHMLGEISVDEHRENRGMLSAVVVHKHDRQPGQGFFLLAEELGYDARDHLALWIEQLNKVHNFWSTRAR